MALTRRDVITLSASAGAVNPYAPPDIYDTLMRLRVRSSTGVR
jgi:hypothetical protein